MKVQCNVVDACMDGPRNVKLVNLRNNWKKKKVKANEAFKQMV